MRRLGMLTQLTFAGILCSGVLSQVSQAEPPERPWQAQANRLAEFNLDSLHNDRTRIPEMLEALHSANYYDLVTAFNSLARLGATEALPDLDALISKYPDDWGAPGKAYRARLLVEAAQPTPLDTTPALHTQPTPSVQAARQALALAKMRGLLSELNLDADKISATMAAYRPDREHIDAPRFPLAFYALRQVADIAYQNGYVPDKTAQDISSLDFSLVPDAALKMRLASLSHSRRVAWLLDDITLKKQEYIRAGNYEKQLLLNEGPAAGPAIAARLQDMSAHPGKYASSDQVRDAHSLFSQDKAILTRLLENLGDNTQAPLVLRLLKEQADRDKMPTLTAKQEASFSQMDQHKRPIVYGY